MTTLNDKPRLRRRLPSLPKGTDLTPEVPDWSVLYARRLLISDMLVLAWSFVGAHVIWAANPVWAAKWVPQDPRWLAMSFGLFAGWVLVLALAETRDSRVVGVGVTEFKRVINSSLAMFGAIALVAYVGQLSVPRSYVLVLLPVALFLLLVSRLYWRHWLHGYQRQGAMVTLAVGVGSVDSLTDLIENLHRHGHAGYQIAGVCVPGRQHGDGTVAGLPVLGGSHDVLGAILESGATSVIVASATETHSTMVRHLSWELEAHDIELILAPAITDVAGPRIHTRQVAGLPLIHVERPAYQGRQKLLKGAFDRVGAAVLLAMFSPLFIGLAIAVKATSPGKVFFRQERIGLDGERFWMLKFRSMRSGADAELAGLLAAQGAGDKPLFKIDNDPRITSIGATLRKYSLDELPQLLNVVKGDMSLVGPRPQVAAEVALYEGGVGRRLFVKPGMTGSWQISGRSDLEWDEAVRLDLSYVENWSVLGDIGILLRTASVVAAGSGAR